MSESEIDYSNTIIYKITCKNPDITDKYVGHTIDFSKRKYAHMNNTNSERSPCYNLKLYKFIRDNGGWDNWKMDIVNFYNCANLREAKTKEQEHYVELKATLNSIKPMKAKEKITKICKDVSPVNKSESRFYCKECDIICAKPADWQRHISTKKHTRLQDKDQENKPKFLCSECQYKCNKLSIFKRHLSTNKHNKYELLKSKNTNNVPDTSAISCEDPINSSQNKYCGNIHRDDVAIIMECLRESKNQLYDYVNKIRSME